MHFDAQMDPMPEPDFMDPHSNITHMTAPMLAFAELKVITHVVLV